MQVVDLDDVRILLREYVSKVQLPELVDDRAAELLQDSSTVTWTYDDANDTLTPVVSLGAIDHGSISGLGDDDHTHYHTDARALAWLGTRSTTDLPEGANLYYTDERVDDRVAALVAPASGLSIVYDDAGNQLGIYGDHGGLSGLGDDDHILYTLADGTRAFTGTVAGIEPAANADLATKLYVDSTVAASGGALEHGSLTGLTDDDHEQYLNEGRHDALAADNPHSVTITQTVTTDGGTDITTTELETLSDGSDADALHTHPGVSGHMDDITIHFTEASIDHGSIAGLGDDDHTQYALVNGTRAFTDPVGGIYPAVSGNLTTKGYVDLIVAESGALVAGGGGVTDHGALTGLSDDDHFQYVLADGNRPFTDPVGGITPATSGDLSTKGYVDDIVAASGAVGGAGVTDHGALTGLNDDDHSLYVLADGTRNITGDQIFEQDIYLSGIVHGLGGQIVNVTNTYYAASADDAIICSGTFTVNLPDTSTGKIYNIRNWGSGTITITGTGGDTVEQGPNFAIIQDEALTVIAQGTDWTVI